MTRERLDMLFSAVGGANNILILPHNDPDPDAIASAVALRHLLAEALGLKSHIVYQGIIGRAENKALVRYLGRPLRHLVSSDLRPPVAVALVDTQPGAGNNPLPHEYTANVVIDHHPWREASATAIFVDVCPDVGATSTMLTEYLQVAGIEPGPRLATALFYGIKTDTMGLSRGASPADVAAYYYLQMRIDLEAMAQIERAQVPVEYYRRLDTTLHAARVYANSVVVSYIGSMARPDMAAEMADLLLRLEGTQWAICVGVCKDDLILAVRTRSKKGGGGQLVQAVVGEEGTSGGHGSMAGGQIRLRGREPEQVADQLRQRVLQHLGIAPRSAGEPILRDVGA